MKAEEGEGTELLFTLVAFVLRMSCFFYFLEGDLEFVFFFEGGWVLETEHSKGASLCLRNVVV